MSQLVEAGRAPHYADLAVALDCTVEEGRQALRAVMASGIPGWLHPGTDYVVSCPPLNNLPTQYRISVNGQQRWFAQCGFESLGVCWLFPGRTVLIEAPCLDCNEPMAIEMRDGELLRVAPADIIGHLNYPVAWATRGTVEDQAFR